MATATEYSGPGSLYLNGVLLAEVSQLTIKTTSNDKDVKTLAKGLSGFSDGAQETGIDFDSAVPAEGMEAEFDEICHAHQTIQLGARFGKVQIEVRGRFMDVTETSDTDNPNKVAMSFKGRRLSRVRV